MRPKPWNVAACGHGIEVSRDRCWDCHVAHLRTIGQGDRADRLVAVKRQHDEGLFDPDAWLATLAERVMAEYAGDVGPDEPRRRTAVRLRRGEGKAL